MTPTAYATISGAKGRFRVLGWHPCGATGTCAATGTYAATICVKCESTRATVSAKAKITVT